MKVAFCLADYDEKTFNLEIESVGEDNSVSDYLPQIVSAYDLSKQEQLKIVDNKILNIENSNTNLMLDVE